MNSLFAAYVALSLAFSMLGLLHGAVFHRKWGIDGLIHAARFGFVDAWVFLAKKLGRGVEVAIDRLDGDKDGDGSWKDKPAAGKSTTPRTRETSRSPVRTADKKARPARQS